MPLSILEAHEWEGDDIYASQLIHEDVGVELNSLDTGYPGNLQVDADAGIPKENGGNPVIRRCTDLDRAVSECLFAIRDFVGDAGCEVEVESFLNFWSTGRDTWLLSVRWPPPEGGLIDGWGRRANLGRTVDSAKTGVSHTHLTETAMSKPSRYISRKKPAIIHRRPPTR